MKKILVLSTFLVLLSGCQKNENSDSDNNEETTKIVKFYDKSEKLAEFEAEIADSPEEHSKGLMFRENMEKNQGMLFIFENETSGGFWMKNTYIPLDMIFIGKNKKIINIETAIPCREEDSEQKNCRSYFPNEKYKYVLEINGGVAKKFDLKAGNKMEF